MHDPADPPSNDPWVVPTLSTALQLPREPPSHLTSPIYKKEKKKNVNFQISLNFMFPALLPPMASSSENWDWDWLPSKALYYICLLHGYQYRDHLVGRPATHPLTPLELAGPFYILSKPIHSDAPAGQAVFLWPPPWSLPRDSSPYS